MIATDKETGKVAWETNLSDGQPELRFSAAPLAVKDKIILGTSGGDRGVRDFIVAVDAATGKLAWRNYVIPAPGEPGSETWKDKNNAWQTGGGAMWVTGSYDVDTNQALWGTGNPVPMADRESVGQQHGFSASFKVTSERFKGVPLFVAQLAIVPWRGSLAALAPFAAEHHRGRPREARPSADCLSSDRPPSLK
jgi:glucose dehydrogenase